MQHTPNEKGTKAEKKKKKKKREKAASVDIAR
jgi:hypothetical protein